MCLPLLDDSGIQQSLPSTMSKDAVQMPNEGSQVAAVSTAGNFYGRRIVWFGAAENKTEPALLQLFSQYGEVVDMFIVRSALGISSGCGHVTFATPQQAQSALLALKGSTDCAEQGTTLGALLIDEVATSSSSSLPKSGVDDVDCSANSHKPSGAGNLAQADPKHSKTVFFTKVPPTVTSQQLIQLFTACGDVAHLELFIPWPGAKISRGCGLVEFSSSSAAAAAVHSMHQLFTWPHSHSALVVEWVDRSRQSTNSKMSKARPLSSAVNSPTACGGVSLTAGGAALPHQAAALTWRPSGVVQQQLQPQQPPQPGPGRSSRSCPLPQLPPGWQVIGTAQQLPAAVRGAGLSVASQWASVPSSLSTLARPRPQQAAGAAATSFVAQQHVQPHHSSVGTSSHAGSVGAWLPVPSTTTLSNGSIGASVDLNSLSLSSVYDGTLMSGSNLGSNANSAANSAVLHYPGLSQGWEKQQQQQQQQAGSGVLDLAGCDLWNVSPQHYSEPMLSGGAGTNDTLLQQLLQHNVMLLQTMAPQPDDDPACPQLLLPTSGPSQAQTLQEGLAIASSTAAAGAGLCLPAYLPLSQAPQLSPGQVLFSGAALQPAPQQRPQQQMCWLPGGGQAPIVQQAPPAPLQQPQQQQPEHAVVALPLTQRQLAAMSGVLPEVPRLTGVQAWISSAATGGLQLCLSGNVAQLQSGHAAVAMLLNKAGIDEPLAGGMVHAAAV